MTSSRRMRSRLSAALASVFAVTATGCGGGHETDRFVAQKLDPAQTAIATAPDGTTTTITLLDPNTASVAIVLNGQTLLSESPVTISDALAQVSAIQNPDGSFTVTLPSGDVETVLVTSALSDGSPATASITAGGVNWSISSNITSGSTSARSAGELHPSLIFVVIGIGLGVIGLAAACRQHHDSCENQRSAEEAACTGTYVGVCGGFCWGSLQPSTNRCVPVTPRPITTTPWPIKVIPSN